jgi:hypothetical protein
VATGHRPRPPEQKPAYAALPFEALPILIIFHLLHRPAVALVHDRR